MSQITTHILDTARGCPAEGVPLALYHRQGKDWEEIAAGTSNADGRVSDLLPEGKALGEGTYRMHFATAGYLTTHSAPVFYPFVDVVFNLDAGGEHYHIPLLLSPFGYSTYRGS